MLHIRPNELLVLILVHSMFSWFIPQQIYTRCILYNTANNSQSIDCIYNWTFQLSIINSINAVATTVHGVFQQSSIILLLQFLHSYSRVINYFSHVFLLLLNVRSKVSSFPNYFLATYLRNSIHSFYSFPKPFFQKVLAFLCSGSTLTAFLRNISGGDYEREQKHDAPITLQINMDWK